MMVVVLVSGGGACRSCRRLRRAVLLGCGWWYALLLPAMFLGDGLYQKDGRFHAVLRAC